MLGFLLTLMGVIVSVGFAVLSVWILYKYIRAYRLPQEQYHLLLGFIHLKWIIWSYIILTIGVGIWAFFVIV